MPSLLRATYSLVVRSLLAHGWVVGKGEYESEGLQECAG